jgi:hypothetical protein
VTTEATTCLACDADVRPGSTRFPSRVSVPRTGSLPGGFLCDDCVSVAHGAKDGAPTDQRLERSKQYGIAISGGYTGAGTPG